jgi:misacylated tRNA(Ala) deacylase
VKWNSKAVNNLQRKTMKDYHPNPKEYDPRMHSAEHILNQTMVRLFDCGRAFSAHIEKKKSKCDYRLDRDLTEKEISAIENKVNEIIQANLPIREQVLSREEAGEVVSLTRLPDDAGERVRIIRIGDYDLCPCSGLHVSTTREIGTFKVISTDYTDGRLRIRFKLM